MNISEHLETTVGKVQLSDIAPILGVSYSTVKRIGWDGFDADQIIAISHHYSLNAVDALVSVGKIEPNEAALAQFELALQLAPTRALLAELHARVEKGAQS